MVEQLVLNLSVCDGRHAMPSCVDGSVFGEAIPEKYVTRPDTMMWVAEIRLWQRISKHPENCIISGWDDEGNEVASPVNVKLNLYVTGLTVATVAVINACHDLGVNLTLWHYDRSTNTYYAQEVY